MSRVKKKEQLQGVKTNKERRKGNLRPQKKKGNKKENNKFSPQKKVFGEGKGGGKGAGKKKRGHPKPSKPAFKHYPKKQVGLGKGKPRSEGRQLQKGKKSGKTEPTRKDNGGTPTSKKPTHPSVSNSLQKPPLGGVSKQRKQGGPEQEREVQPRGGDRNMGNLGTESCQKTPQNNTGSLGP